MPSNHLILCRLLLLPSIFPSIRVFSKELVLRIRWPKYWSHVIFTRRHLFNHPLYLAMGQVQAWDLKAGFHKHKCLQGDFTFSLPQLIKKQRHYFANKGPSSQGYGFSNSHVWMWELDHREGWVPKNWPFWSMVLKKTLESSLDCKEIKLVNPKGNQSCIFIGRTDAEVQAQVSIIWPPDVKSWLIRKDPDAGKDWGQEKGTTEDEMVG